MEKEIFEMLNSNEFINIENYFSRTTYFDVLGISRKESVHSNFWGWLFNYNSNHTLNDYPLKRLLEICYNSLPKNIQKLIALGDYKICNLNISREAKIDDGGFLDIYMNFNLVRNDNSEKLYIIIENKVETCEHDNQTIKYQNWWEKNNKGNNVLMLYFTPNINENIKSTKFIKKDYTELINKILKYCELKEKDILAKQLISEYICCLSKPSILINDDTDYTMLAINDNVKVMVEELIEKYENEIKTIIKDLVDKKNIFINDIYKTRVIVFKGIFSIMQEITKISEDKELISYINKIVNNRIKKFIFNNKEYKTYGRNKNSIGYLVHDMIEYYAKNNTISFMELKQIIDSKIWLSPWIDEIISKNIPNNLEHFFMKEEEKVNLSDCSIYIAKYWVYNDVFLMADLLDLSLEEI